MRRFIGGALMVIGMVPTGVWFGYAVYMFWLGPRAGWLSDEFLHVEDVSFVWCAGMFLGIGVAALGSMIWPED